MIERPLTALDGENIKASVSAIVLFSFAALLISHFAQRMWPLDAVLPGLPATEQYRWLSACLLLIFFTPILLGSNGAIRRIMGPKPALGRLCRLALLIALILISFGIAQGFWELGWLGYGSAIARTPLRSDATFYVAITLDRFSNLTIGAWLGFFSVVVIAPITEELVYRGLLLRRLLTNYQAPGAIILSAFVFMLAHLGEGKLLFTFFAGLIFGYAYARTRCLWYGIAAHMLVNLNYAIHLSIIDFQGRGGDTVMGFSLPYIIVCVISLIILTMLYWFLRALR